MSLPTLCLSLIHLAGSSTTSPPPNIQQLLKTRITHQWQQGAQAPQTPLVFDDPTCAMQGSYHYTPRSLVMIADTLAWRGPLEIDLTSLLEGVRITFETVRVQESPHTKPTHRLKNSSRDSESWKTWLPWTLVAIGIGAGISVWREREAHVQQLNGLAFRF